MRVRPSVHLNEDETEPHLEAGLTFKAKVSGRSEDRCRVKKTPPWTRVRTCFVTTLIAKDSYRNSKACHAHPVVWDPKTSSSQLFGRLGDTRRNVSDVSVIDRLIDVRDKQPG